MEIAGENWLIVGLMSFAAIAMAMTLLILNLIVGPSKPSEVKSAPYESGVPDVSPVKARFTPGFTWSRCSSWCSTSKQSSSHPWAVSFDALGRYGFIAMMVFILLLLEGYVCLEEGSARMGLIDDRFDKNIFVTSLDFVFNWARRSSLWWLQFDWPAAPSR